MRNYAVLNIAVEEAKIFQTKERAPLLLCIEIYRPVEMSIDKPSELEERDDLRQILETNRSKSYGSDHRGMKHGSARRGSRQDR